jgi:hypothetical protein
MGDDLTDADELSGVVRILQKLPGFLFLPPTHGLPVLSWEHTFEFISREAVTATRPV